MKKLIDYSFDDTLWGGVAFNFRAEFYDQLKCTAPCRTHPFFDMFGLTDSTFTIDTGVNDTTTFASCTETSPQSLGHIIGDELIKFGGDDGWNSKPKVSGSHGHRPFEDPTGYYSVNPPGGDKKKKKFNTRWQAIEETDGRGYFTRQEHVAPHIGALVLLQTIFLLTIGKSYKKSTRWSHIPRRTMK